MLRILRKIWAKIWGGLEWVAAYIAFCYIMWDENRRPWRPDKD
jgi:hypothetical protein